MYFKPRVFISSTFSGNLNIRKSIKKFLSEAGIEPLLYETNLTPSVKPFTYREDILSADFVILFIDNKYGSTTETGLSGTEEEYSLARKYNIPLHVYISKKVNTLVKNVSGSTDKNELNESEKLKKFIDRINEDRTSYFIFSNTKELEKKIKENTAKLIFSVATNFIVKNGLSNHNSQLISLNNDVNILTKFIKKMDYRKKLKDEHPLDPITTSIILEPLYDLDYFYINTLVTRCAKDEFSIFIKASQKFTENHELNYTTNHAQQIGKVTVDFYTVSNPSKEGEIYSSYYSKFKEWDNSYTKFKNQYATLLAQFELLK
ncbi:DUF4062 domain-containing protein [Lactiplantibacillus plantarum]|uniref:DUF4062 domain-containing protein n=1 Tax=Lactiplantibacillus plantarum TaxID=1590 RepID=UPI002A75740A|nr:DUF4062 domain-containing protein [Lactiplantibacillus plantarum]MDY2577360.1 DUF4062 domain-containing protein [Lactiplantibacillus plantarum]